MRNNAIQRDDAADLLKGFAIVLLVASHVLQFSALGTGVSYVIPGCSGIVELWARSFNMPLFFFVSGLLIGLKPTPSTWGGTGKAIVHKMRTLLLPGVTFMLLRFVLSGKWEMEWFLKVLFAITVVFLLVRMIANRVAAHTPPYSRAIEVIMHILVFLVWIGVSFIWKGEIPTRLWFHRAAVSYPYLVMGYYYTVMKGKEYMEKHNWVVTLSVILYIGAFYLSSYVLSGRVATYLNAYISAPTAILVCCQVANALNDKSGRFFTALKYCGKHSLAIYLIHMYFMVYCTAAAMYINSVPASFSLLLQIVFGLAGAIPIVAICLAIEYVLAQSKVLNLICFGKADKCKV